MHFSREVSVFHGRLAPEKALLVGYGALIDAFELPLPLPENLSLISEKHRQFSVEGWSVYSPRYKPADDLYGHLVFALKYEGVNLLFFKKLFDKVGAAAVKDVVSIEPKGQYSRRIWFLYEWLTGQMLDIPDISGANYVEVLDEKWQFGITPAINVPRQRIRNNLPGTVGFCPLIFKSKKLTAFTEADLGKNIRQVVGGVHKDLLLRTSAFLMLKDSKASFTIEGENPTPNRALRWGKAIGQAGRMQLTREELLRLQQIVIENSRFVKMGFRSQGGFVGEHDRLTGTPIPEHISAKWEDLDKLLDGLLDTTELLTGKHFHPVLSAAKIAFGFVFIHPFVDGNGRIHRYLIHHLLAHDRLTPQGIIFPVSAAILERIDDYRQILQHYSNPLLDFMEWKATANNNVEVLNETIDYYRYFDATRQAEFLFECIHYTINHIIPQEVKYLRQYDRMKRWLDDHFQMPDKTVALLIRFLEQNNGRFSKRGRENEFSQLSDGEAEDIEAHFKLYFQDEA